MEPDGPVSIARHDGKRLPYAENLVNLIVAEEAGGAGADEMLRVLAPGGVAYVKRGDRWEKTVKPWPDDLDEWTHWLHDVDGNAVARDRVVGPPRHLQWAAAPRWQRHPLADFHRGREQTGPVQARLSPGPRRAGPGRRMPVPGRGERGTGVFRCWQVRFCRRFMATRATPRAPRLEILVAGFARIRTFAAAPLKSCDFSYGRIIPSSRASILHDVVPQRFTR